MSTFKEKPEYLGDGLYAQFDGYQIRLFTQQGKEVFLDASVFAALLRWVETIGAKLK